jgi:hypothetical protein
MMDHSSVARTSNVTGQDLLPSNDMPSIIFQFNLETVYAALQEVQ